MDDQERQHHGWSAPAPEPTAPAVPAAPTTPVTPTERATSVPAPPSGPPPRSDVVWPEPDADGPPPPPWARARRRRRRAVAVGAAVGVLLLVPAGMLAAGLLDRSPPETAGPDQASPDDQDAPVPRADLAPPDPADFGGSDADFATLLTGVEASERTMIRFQDELVQAFGELGQGEDLTPFFAAVRSLAEAAVQQLHATRDDLESPLATPEAEAVRTVYLDHVDAWLALIEAAATDPTVFGPGSDTSRFDLEINATAVDFSRRLEAELPDDAAAEITAYVRNLLDRGFRFDNDAQV